VLFKKEKAPPSIYTGKISVDDLEKSNVMKNCN
jgi:hypothetical protein